jgi:TPR repeat protein
MKRVAANDATSICVLGDHYYRGLVGVQQDHTKAIKLFTRAADLGLSAAHYLLSDVYRKGGDLKKAKFHGEAAAMAGHEVSRCNLGVLELDSGNLERAIKHWKIAASAGCFESMHHMRKVFEQGLVSRESINSMLKAYNNSCVKMRSEARDAYIRGFIDHIGER